MGITSDYSFSRMQKESREDEALIYERIIDSFVRAGENFVKNARTQMQDHAMGTYLDDTTNLRNSIGYYVFKDGAVVKFDGGISDVDVKADIEELVNDKGIQLIGIAGMDYASYVESKGYNVISSQADVCLVDLAVYLETAGEIEQGSAASIEDTFTP